MNTINGKTSVGAQGSMQRYLNANLICVQCLRMMPADLEAVPRLGIQVEPYARCYVCEMPCRLIPVDVWRKGAVA